MELVVREALLCITLSVKKDKVMILASFEENKSNIIALIDYKIETFTSLQKTINAYIEGLLARIKYSRALKHRLARLSIEIILTESNRKLTINKFKKIYKPDFNCYFYLVNNNTKYNYKSLKDCLYTRIWLENKTLVINDRDIEKELKDSLENDKVDEFFKLIYLSFMGHYSY